MTFLAASTLSLVVALSAAPMPAPTPPLSLADHKLLLAPLRLMGAGAYAGGHE